MPLTAWGLLPVNYGALEHTCRPRDPLVAKERERGKNRNKKAVNRWGDKKRNERKGNRSKQSPSSPCEAWIYISMAN